MGPGPADPGDGNRLAAEFENLAGELGDSGATASANALYHAAHLVRMVGHATPITITIDGVATTGSRWESNSTIRWCNASGP